MKIGFVGLGVMGGKMASNVLKAGHKLTVYDIAKENVKTLTDQGAVAGDSAADVAEKSDVIMVSLPNSQIVEGVILGEDGVLEGAKKGSVIIDFSSITPKVIREISEIAAKKGVDVVDAPVSGGAAGAENGTLTIMVGGKKEVFDKVKPYLEAVGNSIKHVGDVGAGDTIKAVNNLLLGINMVATAEALVLGKKAGLKEDVMYDIISKSSGSSYALTAKYEKYISKGNFEPGFMIDLMHKDLQLAVDTAKDLKLPLISGNLSQQIFEAARAEGLGGEDISSVIKIFERWADVEVRSDK